MKILLVCLHKSPSLNQKDFLFHLNNANNFFCYTYENITLIGDFNMKSEKEKLNDICEINKWEHLMLKSTCFKSLFPSTIDLILTNHKQSFMKWDVYEMGCV